MCVVAKKAVTYLTLCLGLCTISACGGGGGGTAALPTGNTTNIVQPSNSSAAPSSSRSSSSQSSSRASSSAASSAASSAVSSSVTSSLASSSSTSAGNSACSPAIVPTPGTQRLLVAASACAAQKLGYAEFVPANYASQATWPLIIAFHGDGEQGTGNATDIAKVDNNGLPRQVALAQWDAAKRFIVLSPQMNYLTRTAQEVHDFIQFAKANYKVDTHRIYLTGLSGGGGPLYRYLDAYAGGEVAAVIPISAVYSFNSGALCSWKHIPVWFFHGSADGTVTSNNSKVAVDGLNVCSPATPIAPRFTEYTGVGHDAWTRTYDLSGMSSAVQPGRAAYSPGMYDWLLQYSR